MVAVMAADTVAGEVVGSGATELKVAAGQVAVVVA